MLKLTTRSRYGMRALAYLGRVHHEDRLVKTAEIARQEQIPVKYLENLLGALRSAGYVQSSRGASGGYRLARPPRMISVQNVLEFFEGPLSLVDCVEADGDCARQPDCLTRPLWQRLSQALDQALGGVTLEDLSRPGSHPGLSRPEASRGASTLPPAAGAEEDLCRPRRGLSALKQPRTDDQPRAEANQRGHGGEG